MAEIAPKTAEAVSVNSNVNVIDDLISNLELDIEARDEQNEIKESAGQFVKEANERIKESTQALDVLTGYMTEEQAEKVENLDISYINLEPARTRGQLNEVAQGAFDILNASKKGEMKNQELYDAYVKSSNDEDPIKYGEFNIKMRSLFSNMRLVREVPEGCTRSHDHIIRVNGFKAGKN